jgi:pyridoxal phosphate enzyme (YggS family)
MNRFEEIRESLRDVRSQIPDSVTLIVVTKTFPVSDLEILYQLGERNFGENRDEEGSAKANGLPSDLNWHYQGRLQSQKLKSILQWADYIHSLDDLSHAKKLDRIAKDLGIKAKVFIQINLDQDDRSPNRSGIEAQSLGAMVDELLLLENVKVVGIMGIGPLGQDPEPGFELLNRLSITLRKTIPDAAWISAGMSGDFQKAIAHGATHVRIGSSILGSR